MQNLIDCADDPQSKLNELERVTKLRCLCEEFAENAARIGKIIISELFLDDTQKTIPPITRYFVVQADIYVCCKVETLLSSVIGGAAGGRKYFHDSIFFKLPVDEMNLYDSEEGSLSRRTSTKVHHSFATRFEQRERSLFTNAVVVVVVVDSNNNSLFL
jgi:hypothetical protein